jgi:transcription antitermination factor NusB
MRKRTKAREYALQILYAVDITKDAPKECIERFWDGNEESSDEVKNFAAGLVTGVCDKRDEIDKLISKHATNWELGRMAVIDRNVLRFSAYELLYMDDIPPKVSINEAIDIAKKFGGPESGKFVNGILDKINKTERKE